MDFGYFTLSDNRYPGHPRTPEQFTRHIFDPALYPERMGSTRCGWGSTTSTCRA